MSLKLMKNLLSKLAKQFSDSEKLEISSKVYLTLKPKTEQVHSKIIIRKEMFVFLAMFTQTQCFLLLRSSGVLCSFSFEVGSIVMHATS